jgi:hypothetical protein
MRIAKSRFTLFSLTVAASIAFAACAQAGVTAVEPAPNAPAPKVEKKAEKKAEKLAAKTGPVDLLRRAYITLAEADHDYDGHRIEAMRKIEEAGKEIGERLSGDGHDHEKQGISDEHLREARNLLNEAKGALKGKALKHIDAAEHQIAIALKIR